MLNEKERLCLQYLQDVGGKAYSYPSDLNPFMLTESGLISRSFDKSFVEFQITKEGEEALAKANLELKDKATRYVHVARKFSFNIEPEIYGYPFLVPLAVPFIVYHNIPILDEKSLLDRIKNFLIRKRNAR